MIPKSEIRTIFAFALASLIYATSPETKYNPCCSFPCQNNGICYTKGFDNYLCDCTRTGYYGRNCGKPEVATRIKKFLKPSRSTLQHLLTNYKFIWTIINNIKSLQKFFMGMVLKVRVSLVPEPTAYVGMDEYTSMDSYLNKSVYARSLPPIPSNCPLPMGVVGPEKMPDPEEIARRFYLRQEFIPCPRRTNLIFPMFAQHFNHQYFKTNPKKGLPFQWGNQMVDISHIYGDDPQSQHGLRSHVDGKMKVSTINGEDFPPRVEDVPNCGIPKLEFMKKENRFAFGHKGFGIMPSFLIFSTIWLREHNRLCDVLKEEHPEWDDERLYQTSRLIVTGETIKIIIEDYVQHLSGFNFQLLYDPDVLMNKGVSSHNQIHLEFHTLYHWHPLVPDTLKLDGGNYTLKDLLMNPAPLVNSGMNKVLTEFNSQFAGAVAGGRNQGAGTIAVAIQTIKDGRRLRFQSFNNYRRRFEMEPYETFEDLTGEKEMAAELRKLYKDIDALELYVGLILEKRRPKQLFGETLTEMGAPYSLKGLYGNPLGAPSWWKPVTFGGELGMNIIKTTTLQRLICDNVAGCPNVSFHVPDDIKYTGDSKTAPNDDTAAIVMNYARNPSSPLKKEDSETCDRNDNNNNCDNTISSTNGD